MLELKLIVCQNAFHSQLMHERKTSASPRRVFYLACSSVSLESNRDFKIQRRGRDESRPEVKIPKMTTTAHDRDVNKPRPCSRRTRWRPFWRCWQTVSISTYFDLFKKVNWHFLFVYRKLNYPGYIPHVFFCCCFLSGSVELANSKHKKHQLPWPRIPNRSE